MNAFTLSIRRHSDPSKPRAALSGPQARNAISMESDREREILKALQNLARESRILMEDTTG
jgi:hypothetical protein